MELARVIKAGMCIESSFQRGKVEAGMDAYQVRTWEGWHHHMALTLIAGLVPDQRNPPGAAVDTGLDSPTSPLRAERIAARDVCDAWCVLHLSPCAASIKAQRVGPILPLSHP
jgi:hypothetical protein